MQQQTSTLQIPILSKISSLNVFISISSCFSKVSFHNLSCKECHKKGNNKRVMFVMTMKHVINAVQTYRLGIEIIYEFIDAAFFISPKTRIFWSLQSWSECPLSLQLTQKMSLGWWAKVQSFPCLHPGRNLHILVFGFLPLLKKSSSSLA